MFKPNFQMTLNLVQSIAEIEHCQGFIHATHLFAPLEKKVDQTVNIADLISKIDPENGKQMQGYRLAFGMLTEHFLKEGEISQELICSMHTHLFRGAITNPQALGKYRTTQNYIYKAENNTILYTPTAPVKIAQSVDDLLKWLKVEKLLPPLIKIALAHLQFLNIHPFTDGNGRTAQLLMTTLLHQAGYDFKDYFAIGEVYLRDRNNYHDAIQSCRGAAKSMTKALEYLLKNLAWQMKEVKKVVEFGAKIQQQGTRVEGSKPLGGRFIFSATKKI